MIHICIVLHCNVQDANITSTHDRNTVLVFFFHAPVAAVLLTVLIFATYTSSTVFLNCAICMFICSCFPVWSYCLYIMLMFYEVLMIPDPYPQSLWKTTTARVFCLFICSFYINDKRSMCLPLGKFVHFIFLSLPFPLWESWMKSQIVLYWLAFDTIGNILWLRMVL